MPARLEDIAQDLRVTLRNFLPHRKSPFSN
jgi:hypothetical protein